MRFPKSKLAETMVVLVVATVIIASFTVARAAQNQNGGGSNGTAVGSGRGGGGGQDDGGDQGGGGGNGGGGNGGGGHGGNGGGNGGGGNGGGGNGGGGNGGGGNGGGGEHALASLKTLPIPVTDLSAYLNAGNDARNAAIALGKALFWDSQSGGDGQQACASCHFNAGADSRTKGQLNPGPAGAWQTLGGGEGANYAPSATEYPLHKLTNMSNRNSPVLSDTSNLTGSQGLHHTKFIDVFPGSSVDMGVVITQAVAPDPFGVADANDATVKVNTRRTTGKNAPSVINAVYNFRNFWDGRAQNVFNGVNPSGANDASAFVLASDPNSGQLLVSGGQPAHQIVRLANAALASQSVGPPNNPTEMSFDGRDFKKLGKKMLSLPPLANQLVATDDSVLGSFSNQSLAPGIPGISTSYQALIQQAFQSQWWNSNALVDSQGNFVLDAQGNIKSGPPSNTDEFTMAEFNFSLFWGIAIQMYESTLVANDSRFDRFLEGDRTALTAQEQQGLNIFQGKGHCTECHMGATLTDASVSNQASARAGGAGNPFPGFHMIGVRPAAEDKIIANGAAKTPGLRNVELTPPYFHNGSQLTLEQVVMFYSRGGDFGTRGVDQDSEIEPRGFSVSDMQALVALLKSMTDPRVANQSAPFDHPSIDVPNGAMGNSFSVTQDGTGNALDDSDTMVHLSAVGMNGANPLPTFTAGLQGQPIGFGPTTGNDGGGSGATTPTQPTGNTSGGGSAATPGAPTLGSPVPPVSASNTPPSGSSSPPVVSFPVGGFGFSPPALDPSTGLNLSAPAQPGGSSGANVAIGSATPTAPVVSSPANVATTIVTLPVSTTPNATTDAAAPAASDANSATTQPDATPAADDTGVADDTSTDTSNAQDQADTQTKGPKADQAGVRQRTTSAASTAAGSDSSTTRNPATKKVSSLPLTVAPAASSN